jgi:hypothetical protein
MTGKPIPPGLPPGMEDLHRRGLSADCKLDPELLGAIMIGGREHPCDRCNMNRDECRGYPRKGKS